MIHELEQRGVHFDAMFRELCLGNEDAVKVCWSVFRFLHVLDDLFDRDHPVTPADLGLSLLSLVETLSENPFWLAHVGSLLPVLRVGVMEWIDSEAWRARTDVREKLAAEVLKSGYQNFFYAIAGVLGGTVHMQAMTEKYRQYQWD